MIISQLKHIECGMYHHAERWQWIVGLQRSIKTD